MKKYFEEILLTSTQSNKIIHQELIQSLWSGYGEILKVQLEGGLTDSAIVKYIDLPDNASHPRGWNTANSHNRKVKSYDVEMNWYKNYGSLCTKNCRIARCFASATAENSHTIILEDLDAAGYPLRKSHLQHSEIETCLKWLAHFHATFLQSTGEGLWEIGSYWHLETRPDELREMADGPLKTHAALIDRKLNSCNFKTLIHGDAKVANFCFSDNLSKVAAVDFQYVGKGCGMKDVTYFLGSCLNEQECQQGEQQFLDCYFSELKAALTQNGSKVDFNQLESEWRSLYAWAWTDFYRFLLGWMPTHYKIHSYTKELSERVLKQLL